jgi:hypothetical protein
MQRRCLIKSYDSDWQNCDRTLLMENIGTVGQIDCKILEPSLLITTKSPTC